MSEGLIRVPCPQCGNVWVAAEQVVLTIYPGGQSYAFECDCGLRHAKACSSRIAELMLDFVRVSRVEPEEHDGPPLEPDDLLDFHLGLQELDWIDELLV